MKRYFCLFLILILSSCQVSETIYLKQDGSGTIEVVQHREENSYMQLARENYSKETVFKDTTYIFKDYIKKYNGNFIKYTKTEQELFSAYENIEVHVKKSALEKDFRTTISQSFKKIEQVPDLYKTENYADDLKYNYALTAEEHNYKVSYVFNENVFKRIVKITDSILLKKEFDRIENLKQRFSAFKLVQSYSLNYHFPRKIKSVSNVNAKISEDRKSMRIEFLLTDCLQNPEITSLEVVLYDDI